MPINRLEEIRLDEGCFYVVKIREKNRHILQR